MTEQLLEWARDRGYKVAWGPVEIVEEARAEILQRHARGELDETFYRTEIESTAAGGVPEGYATVVVVATPAPAYRVWFELNEHGVDTIVPPTYASYRPTFETVRQDLARHGLPGARVEHLSWPHKAVAARLGLARYGRNNITYVDELGSYVQLCAYVTDAPLQVPPRRETMAPALLDECANCTACLSACPTGAIDEDRTLLRGERCLVYVNENPGEWPAWVPPWAHNSLLGCLLCQQACPVNPPLTVVDSELSFSTGETRSLLDGAPAGGDGVGFSIAVKLAWLGQPYSAPVIGRNLRALLAARPRA